jgi:nitronate monooxygenase
MQKSLENNGITKELWDNKAKIDFGKELDASQAETKAWKTLWSAGQGVATIHDVLPVNELIGQMKDEFKDAIERQTKLLEIYVS